MKSRKPFALALLTVFAIASSVTYADKPAAKVAKKDKATDQKKSALPTIPENVTSFGAAIIDNVLYTYGGHTGEAHTYYDTAQANTLWKLDLSNPKKWETVTKGPGLQGLAMVAHDGKLYRIGGFTAKNKKGEEHDLWSQTDVACLDPTVGKWEKMPSLPEPRSSFDAAVMGDKIFVIGGWKLQGDKGWHETAYEMDLSAEKPEWKALPEPPFTRRALAVAAHDGKIYAIGGMQQKGGPSTRVDVYDPKTRSWSVGPALEGKGMTGFGCSAFAVGGKLYVSSFDGKLQELLPDGKGWVVRQELDPARFFHRMLPLEGKRLLIVGGANMSIGKFDEVDIIDVD